MARSDQRDYARLPKEHDTLSGPTQFSGAYDGRSLFKDKPVPPNVVTRHAGEAVAPNDGERALDVSVGRRSFERDEEAGNIFNDK
jgi:hypothetical protein